MTLKEKILDLRKQGCTYNEIKSKLGCSKSTISYHCQRSSKENNNNRLKTLRKRNKEYVQNIKKKSQCSKCGCSDYRCLVFHHINPSIKNDTISNITRTGGSIEKIQNEINKCIILCHNCHKELHFKDSHRHKTIKHINNLKQNSKCNQCGHKGIASLVFHHIKSKKFNIGRERSSRSLIEIIDEISKCEILCSNCHHILHYNEQNGVG